VKCRSCSAEIDAKAIVCYRCGAPTADPVARPTRAAPPRRTALWVVAAIVAVAIAIYLVYFRPV
jgi:hypothetical protein